MPLPKISIITATLNSERFLEQTIKSVIEQKYKNIEYIVIDGASTDGTLEILKKYESKIYFWTSGFDTGIADAMNKGLSASTGDYVLFLHSDDFLLNVDCIAQVVESIQNHDIYFFQVVFDDAGRQKISKNRNVGWWTNFKMDSCHQGQICSKKLFNRIGKFDTSLKLCMDYDFIMRAYRFGVTSKKINQPISLMRLVGISSSKDWNSLKKRILEERNIHYKHCDGLLKRFVYDIYWLLYLPFKKIQHVMKFSLLKL